MYLMMQLADLGTIVDSDAENEWVFNPNKAIFDFVLNKINTDEEL